MSSLSIKNVSHWFGNKKILYSVNLEIQRGEFVSLVGPSGCGKSTLLKAILGTHPPKSGAIYADGKLIVKPQRDIGIVYQHYTLFEFMTAQENVALGLALDQTSMFFRAFSPLKWRRIRKTHLEQAKEFLSRLGLDHATGQYPSELSGGMKQRVAIAQALIMRPSVLLLDEPFGALDEATREESQLLLLQLYRENLEAKKAGQQPPHTVLIVTHELNEAIYVSSRVVGLSQYHPEGQNGSTIVYDKPAPVFSPDDSKEFDIFKDQREEIRRKVFDPKNIRVHEEQIRVAHAVEQLS
jgi:NitT/TauT family transport system ATP-binding protein